MQMYRLRIVETSLGYIFVILGMGISQAMFGLLIGLSWPRLFGITHLGAISGFALSATVFGSGIGPVLFSLSLTYAGSYFPISIICAGISGALVLFSLRSKV